MTYPQFKLAIEGVGEKLNLNIKLAKVSSAPEAWSILVENDFPLHPKKSQADEEQVFRMSDAMKIVNMAK